MNHINSATSFQGFPPTLPSSNALFWEGILGTRLQTVDRSEEHEDKTVRLIWSRFSVSGNFIALSINSLWSQTFILLAVVESWDILIHGLTSVLSIHVRILRRMGGYVFWFVCKLVLVACWGPPPAFKFVKRLKRVRLLEQDSLEEASDFFFLCTTEYNCLVRDVL